MQCFRSHFIIARLFRKVNRFQAPCLLLLRMNGGDVKQKLTSSIDQERLLGSALLSVQHEAKGARFLLQNKNRIVLLVHLQDADAVGYSSLNAARSAPGTHRCPSAKPTV